MARIRADYVFGTTDAALAAGDTSLSSPELARLPAVTAPDVAVVTLHDSTAGTYEIVHVTAHTASATTATILRAQEGSSAQAWASGTTWLHGATATDFASASGSLTVQDENANVSTSVSQIDFQGAGVTVTSGTGEVTVTIPGGSGGGSTIDAPPATPNAMDEEFNGTSLDAKWSWVNQGTSSIAFNNGLGVLSLSSTGDQMQGIVQPAPAGTWKFRAKTLAPMTGTTYRQSGLLVMASLAGAYRLVGAGANAASGIQSSSPTATTGTFAGSGPAVAYSYVEAEWDGTQVTFRVSGTGIAGTFEQVATWSPGAAPSHVGLGGGTYQQTAPGSTPRTYEWFRRTA